jgi:hypothetical protein
MIKYQYMKVILYLVAFTLFSSMSFAPGSISKEEVQKRITAWYEANPDGYSLDVKGDDAKAKITRYHPERPDELDHLLVVEYRGMSITMHFNKPMKEIEKTPEAYQQNFSYVAIDDIYHTIKVPGWDVNPRTPQSSNSNNDCVTFTAVSDDHVAYELNWETYTVMGYSVKKNCQDELQIEDGAVSEGCIVYVEKRLPLKLSVDAKFAP